ncbi:universal stress protein [Mucilaginibacter paludis]|uniref:Universal stress protein n=1 Tax=Mucilaginibacter paludis DSM 18603 TaxID=714943 RepID=H1Y4K3_9SPHI|nr:universal stress protein [Mucilaginibacter paludis]EHQ26787.1 UspA domain-containing protein [Mucilaginibacter paludis DSM 18603]
MKFQRVLIGIDDSKYAENAAQYGFELARQFNAEVALVHIVEPVVTTPLNDSSMMGSIIPSLSGGVEEAEVINAQQEYSRKLINDTIDKLGSGLTVTQFNEIGSTSDTIIDCAARFRADLIVIGTHSRTGLDRFLMGSVAESIVRHSPVAVLVIPMKEEEAKP